MQGQSPTDPGDLQRQTLRLYGELVSRRENWGGKLVLACGEGSSATGLPAATSIAGGTSLVVDPDAGAVKSVLRQGGIDFVVNSLDEALRTLKNEIRQKRPLGVALTSQPALVLNEMIERGVLPDFQIEIADRDQGPGFDREDQLNELAQLGMERLKLVRRENVAHPSENLLAWLNQQEWHETLFVRAPNTSDQSLLAMQSFASGLRRRWLEQISRYQRIPGDARRLVWMTGEEQKSFAGLA